MNPSIKKAALITSALLFSSSVFAYGTYSNYSNYSNNRYASDNNVNSVGQNSGGSLHQLSRHVQPTGERVFAFSPRLKMWAAYDSQGRRVAYGKANGGSDYCPDLNRPCHTPTGTFRIYKKGSSDCKSSRFPLPMGGAPMPYCMHFQGGNAIHGSQYVSTVNSSHGCIRVTTPAAQWLSSRFAQNGTKVMVLSY
jgi:hypothetical protein